MINAKILITGGTGFVGKHLQEELKERQIPYLVFAKRDYDLTVKEQAEAVFSANSQVGLIIHLASFQAAGDFPAKHPAEQFHLNNLIHTNVLEAWRKFAPQAKMVAVGSSCGYPSRETTLTEDKFLDGNIHGSVYSYAFTKRLLYTGVRAYNDQYGLNGSYLIPPTLFGEYDDFNVETAHVCGALIAKFVRAVREDLPEVEIWGDGTQIREFMYVKDFVRALLYLAEKCNQDIVNVGPGEGVSIKDLSHLIRNASGYNGRLFFNPDRYVGVKEKFLNADRLQEKYNLKISNDLSQGMERTVSWAFQNFDGIKDKRKFA